MKILKLLFAAIIATTVSVSATAQDKAHFGVRVAYDMTTSTKVTEVTGWGSGFSAGVIYYAPFGKMTFFQPGLMFYVDNIKLDGTTKNKYNPIPVHTTAIYATLASDCRSTLACD